MMGVKVRERLVNSGAKDDVRACIYYRLANTPIPSCASTDDFQVQSKRAAQGIS